MSLWERNQVLDAWHEDGEGVVLLPDGRVLALNQLSWSLWSALESSAKTEVELVERVVEEFGRPYDEQGNDLSRSIVIELLKVLESEAILTRLDARPS
jgi:hypothetical protein